MFSNAARFPIEPAQEASTKVFFRVLLIGACMVAFSASAQAGSLIVENTGKLAISCSSSEPVALALVVPAGKTMKSKAPKSGTVASVKCGSLTFRHLDLSAASGDRILVLNGRQTRTLLASLFPYIPTPNANFDALIAMLESGFQSKFPDVALDLIISQDIDTYDFSAFPKIFGPNGYDTVEVDTSVLSALVNGSYITPTKIVGDAPLPAALSAVTSGTTGITYGVPTWLCRDFLYSYDVGVLNVNGLPTLLSYLKTRPTYQIGAIFNGRWTLLGMYVNGMVSTYGYNQTTINNALTGAVDPTVIDGLAAIANYCAKAGANPCIDGTYKNAPDGTLEQGFAEGFVSTDAGYSERTFYIQTTKPTPAPYVVQMPYGPTPIPMMYVDALVRSAARCANDPCASDAANLAAYFNTASVRASIAFTQDVQGAPARHLLPAISTFYTMPQVVNDPIYSAVIPLIGQMQPSPNSINLSILNDVSGRVCAALQSKLPTYKCPSA